MEKSMKKMKILTLLLCASLSFAYMGCSNSSGGSDSGTSTPSGNNGNGTPVGAGGNGDSGGSGTGSGGGNSNSTPYTKADTQTINGVEYDIVTFGTFPQSEKTDDTINVNESKSKNVGSFTYYTGSDGEWYAKLESKYYKVEPIKWRVLTTNYNGSGKKLLLAENILINKAYHASSNNYENSSIRAYLTDDFFTTAFTTQEQSAIASTTVVNNAASTNPDGSETEWLGGVNQYTSKTPTEDKIFLLSEQEATKSDYGFAAYDISGTGNTRIRMTTAFAKANGAPQNSTADYDGFWWLRSPHYYRSDSARDVKSDGKASSFCRVDSANHGVVPALCLN